MHTSLEKECFSDIRSENMSVFLMSSVKTKVFDICTDLYIIISYEVGAMHVLIFLYNSMLRIMESLRTN